MILRPCCIAALTAVLALSGVAGASAATKSGVSGKSSPSRAKVTKTVTAKKGKGAGVVKPVRTGTSVVYISAFPTGGKGSGTEATCALWSNRLQEDQQIIDNAPEADRDDASGPLNEDIDNALDAGCVVIY